eukprot:613102-Prorocentrum_minimum.AAC.1
MLGLWRGCVEVVEGGNRVCRGGTERWWVSAVVCVCVEVITMDGGAHVAHGLVGVTHEQLLHARTCLLQQCLLPVMVALQMTQ